MKRQDVWPGAGQRRCTDLMIRLIPIALVIASVVYLSPGRAIAGPACGPAWTKTAPKNPDPGNDQLDGVAAISATDAWAVGTQGDVSLAEQWDGSAWTVVPTPNPSASLDRLFGVSAVSASDVWASGDSTLGTLIEHWNGSSWSAVSSPSPGTAGALSGISMDSGTDGWAAGTERTSGTEKTLLERWNGTSWSVVASPNVGSLGAGLAAVVAVSPTKAWAVGHYVDNTDSVQPLVEKWNGTSWKVASTPSVGGGELTSIAAAGGQLWASGGYWPSMSSYEHTLVERFDGSAWSVQTTPSPSTNQNELDGVAAASPQDVWAVGLYTDNIGSSSFSLAEHFDGSTWSQVSAPSADTFLSLLSVAVTPDGEAVAVGGPAADYSEPHALAEQICPVQVLDSGFAPAAASEPQGSTVTWQLPASDTQDHSVTDTSGLGLYDSGLLSPGGSFTYTFSAAGTYTATDSATDGSFKTQVPIQVSPKTGSSADTFTVTWSDGAPPAGDMFDVQVKAPGATAFTPWRTGVTATSDSFASSDPAWTGSGTYVFRARIRDGSGHHSGWSPGRSLVVS